MIEAPFAAFFACQLCSTLEFVGDDVGFPCARSRASPSTRRDRARFRHIEHGVAQVVDPVQLVLRMEVGHRLRQVARARSKPMPAAPRSCASITVARNSNSNDTCIFRHVQIGLVADVLLAVHFVARRRAPPAS